MQRAINILAAKPAGVGIAFFAAKSKLGCKNDSVAIATLLQKFANESFACAIRVTICGINEVSARVKKVVENLPRSIFGSVPTPIRAKGHGA